MSETGLEWMSARTTNGFSSYTKANLGSFESAEGDVHRVYWDLLAQRKGKPSCPPLVLSGDRMISRLGIVLSRLLVFGVLLDLNET